jgi:hypothetical protein
VRTSPHARGSGLRHPVAAAGDPALRDHRPVMVAETLLWGQGYGRLQFGLTPLLATSFEGFAVPYFARSSAGLSWHPRRCPKYGLRSPCVLAQFAFGTRFA